MPRERVWLLPTFPPPADELRIFVSAKLAKGERLAEGTPVCVPEPEGSWPTPVHAQVAATISRMLQESGLTIDTAARYCVRFEFGTRMLTDQERAERHFRVKDRAFEYPPVRSASRSTDAVSLHYFYAQLVGPRSQRDSSETTAWDVVALRGEGDVSAVPGRALKRR